MNLMKKINLFLLTTLVFLSGCADLMYGTGLAPVSNRNVYANGQRQPQYNQPRAGVYGNIPSSNAPVEQAHPRIVPQNQAQVAQNQANYPVPQPYNQPAHNQNDGWDAPAQTEPRKVSVAAPAQAQAPARNQEIYDEPKYDKREVATSQAEKPASEPEQPKAVRPAAADAPKPAARTEEPAPQAEKAVASNQKTAASGGTKDLIAKAKSELDKGNLDKAASYLEDASRIDSGNAKIMYDIANIRFHQGKYRAAEQMAARAARTGGASATQKKSWELISHARDKLGDKQGAVAAAERAASF